MLVHNMLVCMILNYYYQFVYCTYVMLLSFRENCMVASRYRTTIIDDKIHVQTPLRTNQRWCSTHVIYFIHVL